MQSMVTKGCSSCSSRPVLAYLVHLQRLHERCVDDAMTHASLQLVKSGARAQHLQIVGEIAC